MLCSLRIQVEVHLHLQLNRNRLAVQGGRLILPLQHGLQRRIHEQRMSAHHACLDDIPVFIDHRLNNHCAPNVRLSRERDRKSTRLNSSHTVISYAVFCLKKKKKQKKTTQQKDYK